MGNFLNGGTTKGGAFGFKLSTLPKVSSISIFIYLSINNQSTEIHSWSLSIYWPLSLYLLIPVQLNETTTSDNKSTLLHYLVKVIREKYSNLDLVSFPEDVKSVRPAQRGIIIIIHLIILIFHHHPSYSMYPIYHRSIVVQYDIRYCRFEEEIRGSRREFEKGS